MAAGTSGAEPEARSGVSCLRSKLGYRMGDNPLCGARGWQTQVDEPNNKKNRSCQGTECACGADNNGFAWRPAPEVRRILWRTQGMRRALKTKCSDSGSKDDAAKFGIGTPALCYQ